MMQAPLKEPKMVPDTGYQQPGPDPGAYQYPGPPPMGPDQNVGPPPMGPAYVNLPQGAPLQPDGAPYANIPPDQQPPNPQWGGAPPPPPQNAPEGYIY